MAIPKIIHQTFKTSKLPFITRWHIAKLRNKNPDYTYEFYDDERIEAFLKHEFDEKYIQAYKRLNIGAAKADFFRYAVLYKKGGIYLDIDCHLKSRFEKFIFLNDVAVLSPEKNPKWFVQWAMFYAPFHPFLKKTLALIIENISENRYPHDVHKMTGPDVYSAAIRQCISENPNVEYRVFGVEYDHHIKDKYKLAKFFLYKDKSSHWKRQQINEAVLKAI
ncbi:MAG: glycosyl transferase [Pedobacter sp.]|nr:MAG: glycosyl transferase [Pedobacter sp.]